MVQTSVKTGNRMLETGRVQIFLTQNKVCPRARSHVGVRTRPINRICAQPKVSISLTAIVGLSKMIYIVISLHPE